MMTLLVPLLVQEVMPVVVVPPTDYTSLIVAVGTLVTTIVTGIIAVIAALRAGTASNQSHENARSLGNVRENIQKIETNTNSLTQRLEASSGRAGMAEGMAAGVALERANPQVSKPTQQEGINNLKPAGTDADPVKVEVANPTPVPVQVVNPPKK